MATCEILEVYHSAGGFREEGSSLQAEDMSMRTMLGV